MRGILKNYKNIFRDIEKNFSKYRWSLGLLYILTLISSLLELLPIYYFGKAIDFITQKNFLSVVNIIILLCIILVINLTISFFETYLSNFLSNKVTMDMKNNLFNSILKTKMKELDKIGTGELFSIIDSDCCIVVNFIINDILRLVVSVASAIITLVFILKISIKLTLVSIMVIPSYYIIGKYFGKYISKRTRESRILQDNQNMVLQENLLFLKEVKTLNIQDIMKEKYKNILDSMLNINLKIVNLNSFSAISSQIVANFFEWILLAYSTWLIIYGDFTIGNYVAFKTYLGRFTAAMSQVLTFKLNFNKIQISLERINKILKLDEELGNESPKFVVERGNIDIKNSEFKYEGSDKKVIDNLSLNLAENRLYSIVGYSGCGKSTLLNLLINLYEINRGSIYIDSVDINDISVNDLRKSITYIQQKPHIFNGSIKDNLIFVNENVTMDEIIEACKLTNIHDFIQTLPDKYDTTIGEMGVKLSGGQAQRIAIARAILRKSKILLLDEVTSELDGESEYYIMNSLKNLSKTCTVIIIAHRLSTVINTEKVYVMNSGKIESCGTHEELLNSSTTYRSLFGEKDKICL